MTFVEGVRTLSAARACHSQGTAKHLSRCKATEEWHAWCG